MLQTRRPTKNSRKVVIDQADGRTLECMYIFIYARHLGSPRSNVGQRDPNQLSGYKEVNCKCFLICVDDHRIGKLWISLDS